MTRQNPLEYDPRCAAIGTAIRAIWKLYTIGEWSSLEYLGLSRTEWYDKLLDFEEHHLTPHIKRLMVRESDTVQLIKEYPTLLDAAILLNGEYIELTGVRYG